MEFYKPDRHTNPASARQEENKSFSETQTAYAEPDNIRIVVDKDTPPRQDSYARQGSIPSPSDVRQQDNVISDITDAARVYGERIMDEINPQAMGFNRKLKNRSISIFLCALFGIFGAHRFYEGKIITGILWALTGGLGLFGWIIDLIILINKPKYYEP